VDDATVDATVDDDAVRTVVARVASAAAAAAAALAVAVVAEFHPARADATPPATETVDAVALYESVRCVR